MGKKVSFGVWLTVSAGDEDDYVLYTVEAARRFVTKSVYVYFPPGTYGELEISIKRGIKQIAPYSGSYRGDACVIEDEFIEDISSAERVIIHYKNNNTTNTKEAFIIVRGVLE